jgi:CubicO group peptidase (beta-lactamase class C family)
VPLDVKPDLGGALDIFLRSQVERGFSGVVLVAQGDSVVLHRAYSADARLTPETAFWIGSLTKPFAATAILKLQEQGHLSVSSSISEYLPDVPSGKRAMTIHQLLTHTSGLGHRYVSEGITNREEAIRTILALPLEHAPGQYGYSNDGYSLLAAIISRVSGLPYEEYLRRYLLEPAGMTQSGFWGEPVAAAEAPVAPVRNTPKPRVAIANWGYRGATGLRSTARDLLRWHRALLGDSVLADSTKSAAFSPQIRRSEDAAYGYGWQVLRTNRGTTLIAHSGAESGLDHYSSLRRYIDEGIAVVLLSNAPEELTWDVQRGLLAVLFAHLKPSGA